MKHYLIIKIGALGDTIMSLPLAQHIKTSEKNARITWMAGKGASEIVKLSPYVDRIVILDDRKLFKGTFFQRILTLIRANLKVGLKKYTKIITGHADSRYLLLSILCAGRKVRFKPEKKQSHSRQYVQLYDPDFDGNSPLSYGADLSGLPVVNIPFDESKKVMLSPGGAKNLLRDDVLRRWPLENYVRLASMLKARGYTVILIGGPDDRYCEEQFSGIGCHSFIGKLTITETLSLLKKSGLFISHDSGPLHMAALAGAPVISIFGSTFRHELLCKEHYCFQGGQDLPCSPCYDGKDYAPCTNPLCMKETTPDMVFHKAVEMLERPDNKGKQ